MFATLVSAVRSAQLEQSFNRAKRHFVDRKAEQEGLRPDFYEEDEDGEPTEIAKSVALGGGLVWGPTMEAAVSLESARNIGQIYGRGRTTALIHYSR